jgi:hypothetical protein
LVKSLRGSGQLCGGLSPSEFVASPALGELDVTHLG